MKRPALILLILLCFVTCIPLVQAGQGQTLPFSPPGNVTGNYTYAQGNDFFEINTNFPISSQDVVYPDWLFGMMLVFIVITVYFGLVFIREDPAPWVSVIACGVLIFGLGLSAAMMAPLVGYTQVFHQVIPLVTSNGATSLNSTNTVYVDEIIVYTMGIWTSYACYGIAVGGGLIFMVAGVLLQMKEAKRIADAEQAQRNADAENYMQGDKSIQWRKRDRL
jgi:hypothetical protein